MSLAALTVDHPNAVSTPLYVRETLVTCNVGSTLFLKLCGFIEDCEARILDVDVDHLRVRVGRTWVERWWHGLRGHSPLEVRIAIRPVDQTVADWQRTNAGAAVLDVHVCPLGPRWTQETFDECARRAVHKLRLHLMAS